MVLMKKTSKGIKYLLLLIAIILVVAVIFVLYYNSIPKKVSDPKPFLTARMLKCELDMRDEGVFSFFFNARIKENKTRVPAEIFFKINNIYNLEKYEIVREYGLERVYNTNETIENVSFFINNVYKDYMYLPSQNFDFQLFYCEFTDQQKNYMKENNIKLFNALNEYCILVYDYEMFYEKYIHVVNQNPGEQCEVIHRSS
jgi:hypothetical protein